jgi:hypothetical protein
VIKTKITKIEVKLANLANIDNLVNKVRRNHNDAPGGQSLEITR